MNNKLIIMFNKLFTFWANGTTVKTVILYGIYTVPLIYTIVLVYLFHFSRKVRHN